AGARAEVRGLGLPRSPRRRDEMLQNSKLHLLAVLAAGLALGYAAAAGKLNPFQRAGARAPERPAASDGPAGEPVPARPRADGISRAGLLLAAHNSAVQVKAAKSGKRPNILVLWGDDIGYWNVSAYNRGAMGYRTPNIDRIAKEGAVCTDCYAQQSCTAGRAAFITGQSPFRTGLLKVGLPGAREGLSEKDPTIAD